MATIETGRDGVYRMTIDDRYAKISGVRREAKLFAIFGGLYSFFKLGLSSVPVLVYGHKTDSLYLAGVSANLLIFVLFAFASGGGKPQKESRTFLWVYAIAAAAAGSKALLDAWNNPYARSLLTLSAPATVNPYDQSVAKLLVQKLSLDPDTAVRDVDVVNLWLNFGGALALLASAAATVKYLQLRKQPTKVKVEKKKT